MRKTVVVITVIFALAVIGVVFAASHKYTGVTKCAMCHKSESKGNQYGQWLSSKHANAYKTLATDVAKETAQKAGVAGDPQAAVECLECHTTAYGVDAGLLGEGFKKEEGVQCESCHGAGGDYYAMSVMKDKAKSIEAGLIIPSEEMCVKCHNAKSPNFKGFNYKEYYEKITHPQPK